MTFTLANPQSKGTATGLRLCPVRTGASRKCTQSEARVQGEMRSYVGSQVGASRGADSSWSCASDPERGQSASTTARTRLRARLPGRCSQVRASGPRSSDRSLGVRPWQAGHRSGGGRVACGASPDARSPVCTDCGSRADRGIGLDRPDAIRLLSAGAVKRRKSAVLHLGSRVGRQLERSQSLQRRGRPLSDPPVHLGRLRRLWFAAGCLASGADGDRLEDLRGWFGC